MRNILPATVWIIALLAGTAHGQTRAEPPPPHAAKTQPAPKGPRAAPKEDPFAVTNWFEIPDRSNIASGRDAHGHKIDLVAREDANAINVYGRKQKFEPRQWFRVDQDEPWVSSAAPSVDMPVRQNSSCEGAAYNTVGGQPATGRDMVGALGAGSGC